MRVPGSRTLDLRTQYETALATLVSLPGAHEYRRYSVALSSASRRPVPVSR